MSHLRSHHSLSDILYFLKAFLTDATRCFGEKGFRTPDMMMCDGLVVLMQAIGLSFAKKKTPFGLDTLNHYYMIATGKAKKNAKGMCRK